MSDTSQYRPPPTETGTDSPIVVTNVSVGDIEDGDQFEEGTTALDVLRAMLTQPQQGTVGLSGTNPKVQEVGASFSPTLTADPEQRQSGPLESLTIDAQDVMPSPYELAPTFQIGAAADVQASRSFQAVADFEASDDFGAHTATSGQVVYRGRRFIFYGTSNAAPGSSADVRGLGQSILDARDGKVFQIDVPSGATSVEFAYPAALGEVQLIEFQGALTSDVTAEYGRSTISVDGAPGDGSYAIDYYVYRREPQDSYSDVTIEVTI